MHKPLGAGIIGAGVIFRNHAAAYNSLKGRVRLVGLSDLDEFKINRSGPEYFIPYTTTDYHELIAREDIDLVSICTPPTIHEQMVKDCLDAGKYVICEKPLAATLAASDRILEYAEKYPGKLSTVFQMRYANNARRTIWSRDNGLLGDLAFGRFQRQGILLPAQIAKGWWGRWEDGGGAVMTQSIHELDLILHFFGPVTRVKASIATMGHSIESEDTFGATMEHENGAVTTCSCTLAGNVSFYAGWSVIGTEAAIQQSGALHCGDKWKRLQSMRRLNKAFPVQKQKTLLPGVAGKVANKVISRIRPRKRKTTSNHTPYVAEVLDAINENNPLPVGPEEARRAVELCTAIHTSAIKDEAVSLPLDRSAAFYDGVTTNDYDGRSR
ncbi:MAG: Gfo/Idh/MocA family protein [Aeoliella sp.]